MYTCKFCNRDFEKYVSLGGHVVTCKFNPNYTKLNKNRSMSNTKERIQIERICEKCGIKFEQLIKNGSNNNYIRKFCSRSCANSKKHSLQTKNKIRNSILELNKKLNKILKTFKKQCYTCKETFNTKRETQKFCSSKCFKNSKEYKNKVSKMFKKIALKRYANGDTTIGWQTRKQLIPSYPEQITMKILNELLIKYEFEKHCGKYFIDFAINEKMIALEIDGKQHEYKERKESDNKKDIYLTENGWKVIRIKWKNDYKHRDRIVSKLKNIL